MGGHELLCQRQVSGELPAVLTVPALRIILGDQLSPAISALDGIGPGDVVLMAEVVGECTYVRHHAKKIVLVLSAMRHFAADLRVSGFTVDYVALDDGANSQTLAGEVARAVARHRPGTLIATEPGEWRVLNDMQGWRTGDQPVEIRDDTRFLGRIQDFRKWADGRKTLRMEFFYREMRRRHGILLDGAEPEGGRWNFDSENRRKLPAGAQVPALPGFPPDDITTEIMALVAQRFPDHFGDVAGFDLPVTARDAEKAFSGFMAERMAEFGDWQDAMKAGAPVLFHALIASTMNIGLLDPLKVCRDVEAAYRGGKIRLNAAEGFIRQILGWREFIRGIYWLNMPDYAGLNALGAHRKLPEFYWSGETRMRCIAEVVSQTREHAYAHHIQRLMVTGNFALLAGLDPDEVDEWYMIVFADAYEWVEMPNTRGMALFADGGIVGSKPYAASGAYINRMSDYCRGCAYDVAKAVGEGACPFNALYWDFVARHADRLAQNTRMAMPVRSWAKMEKGKQTAIRKQAGEFLARLDEGTAV